MADSIALDVHSLPFAELSKVAHKIHEGYLDNVADFPSPKPTMATFSSHLVKFDKHKQDWGTEGNRGRHSDNTALRSSAKVIRRDLRLLIQYAMNTQPDSPKLWLALGFPLAKQREKNQTLAPVQDLRRFISRTVPLDEAKLKWKLPQATKRNLIKGYVIQWSQTDIYPEDSTKRLKLMNVLDIVTETTYWDKNPLPGLNCYWVTAFNSQGMGVTAGPIMVNMPQRLAEEE